MKYWRATHFWNCWQGDIRWSSEGEEKRHVSMLTARLAGPVLEHVDKIHFWKNLEDLEHSPDSALPTSKKNKFPR